MLRQALSAISVPAVTMYSVIGLALTGFFWSNNLSLWGIHAMGFGRHGPEHNSIAAQLQRAGQTGNLNGAGTVQFWGSFLWPIVFVSAFLVLRDVCLVIRATLAPLVRSVLGYAGSSERGGAADSAGWPPAPVLGARAAAAAPATPVVTTASSSELRPPQQHPPAGVSAAAAAAAEEVAATRRRRSSGDDGLTRPLIDV